MQASQWTVIADDGRGVYPLLEALFMAALGMKRRADVNPSRGRVSSEIGWVN